MSDPVAAGPRAEAALAARVALREEKVAGLRDALSAKKRALLDRLVAGRAPAAGPRAAIARRPGAGPAVLSFVQERIWLRERLRPEGPAGNVAAALRLSGELDVPVLARSLGEVVRRHEVLRTVVVTAGAELRQVAAAARPVALPVVDLRAVPAGRRKEEVRRIGAAQAGRPFDVAHGLFLRAALLRSGKAEWLALVDLHAAAGDAGSVEVLAGELAALYRAFSAGEDSPLPELPIQYADFAAWQRGRLTGKLLADELAYWQRELDGAPDLMELPLDRPRVANRSRHGEELDFALSRALVTALAALAGREGASLSTALLAGFQALLGRWTGQDDLLVGSVVANRNPPEVEGLIGPFANLLALRARLAGAVTCRELLGRTRAAVLAAQAHQELPFEALVEELCLEQSRGIHPLVQAALRVESAPRETLMLPGLALRCAARPDATAELDLLLAAAESEGELRCRLAYARDLFDRATVARLAGHFASLLHGFVDGPETPLSEVPLLSAVERHQVQVEWGAGASDEGEAEMVCQALAAQARMIPDVVAVAAPEGLLTYGELEHRANRLAWRLRALGVGPEVPVAVCAGRSAALVVGLAAILEAGGAYVPLDPAYPTERLALLLADVRAGVAAPVVLADERSYERLRGGLARTGSVLLSLDRPLQGIGEDDRDRPLPALRGSCAYTIYTSGSTGMPKGVQVEHGSLANLARWHRAAYGVGPGDRVTQIASPAFDAAVWEVWPCLAAGACLAIPDEETRSSPSRLVAWLAAESISSCFLPTPLAEAVLAEDWPAGTALHTLLTGGDRLHRAPRPGLPFRLVNHYGPTESTVVTTCATVRPSSGGGPAPAIGRPIAGTRVQLLDRYGQPVPLGVAGELCTGGAGLARGYLHRPELTAERFVPDPLGSPGSRQIDWDGALGARQINWDGALGVRLYRTGDLVRWRADGEIEFLGRIDQQVKVRGFRIELGEIEAALAAHPGVREAVVVVREIRQDRPGDLRLVAYVVPAEGRSSRELVAELPAALSARLPHYMVPAAFVVLAALPLSANGKVDRRALPAPGSGWHEEKEEGGRAAARTPVEEILRGIWSDLLGVEARRLDGASNFFALGGHSLLATQVASRVRDLFRVELAVRDLFESSTLSALAAAVSAASGGTPGGKGAAAAPPIRPVPRDVALPLSFAQERLWFLDALQPGSAAYNIAAALRLRGRLRVPALASALAALVARHEPLRTTFLTRDGRPFQVIAPRGTLALPVVDLRALGAAEQERAVRGLGEQQARTPFDLVAGPVLRATLLRLADGEKEEYALLLALHHIAGDGWSVGIFVRELGELYAARLDGRDSPLARLPIQYADFAAWQREWLAGAVLENQLAWWRERLAGMPARLDLPLDLPRSTAPRRPGATVAFPLTPGLTRDLAALSQRSGVTLFMTLFAGFGVLLCRLAGHERLAVGSPVANRTRTEVEGLIGMFVNTLALAVDLRGDPDFAALLVRGREMALGAYAHQDLPFERLVEDLQDGRPDHPAIFQAMLVVQNAPLPSWELPGLALGAELLAPGDAKFDLTLSFSEGRDGLSGVLEYDADLFDRTTVARWTGCLTSLLAAAAADPGLPVSELPLLAAAERQALLGCWNEAGPHGARAAVEAALLALWRELLEVEQVGVEDSFFDLGGHPALVARLAARILGLFHVEIRPRQIHAASTVAGLTASILAELA